MRGPTGVTIILLLVFSLAPMVPFSAADTVIGAEGIELIEAGDFSDSEQWEITSTAGFSGEQAEYSGGMVADGELSFTHDRPDNFEQVTSWATYSPTLSNYTLGEPDSDYTWSKGPNITMNGYDFSGLHGMQIANVSMVLHFSIPDALSQDTVRIVLQNHGSDKLVVTFGHTFGPILRMSNPLVLPLEDLVQIDWGALEDTQFTVDYASQGTSDDSEVQVDAVGLRVKYHQPWYSFETTKARHTLNGVDSPVVDFGPYDGEISGLSQVSCGLTPNGPEAGIWTFDVEVPPLQQLGRLHVYGAGNHTIWALPDGFDGDYSEKQSGELLDNPHSTQQIRIDIEDGCISGARVDINDPHLVAYGAVSGELGGLADTSYIRFAVGSELIASIPMEDGAFVVDVPVGYALPERLGEMIAGVAARFQWSSNGTAETTVVHIHSISITGGYDVEWDLDPECMPLDDMSFNEDDAGVHIPMDVRCIDDLTAPEDLALSAVSGDPTVIEATIVDQYVRIQPVRDAWGEASVMVVVEDERGNTWTGEMSITVNPIEDPPVLEGLPLTVYIELGETMVVDITVTDSDTQSLTLSASRSWATFDTANDLILTPVESGSHIVEIGVSDGTNDISQSIEVVVTAKPDLLIESIDVRRDGLSVSELVDGDVIEIYAYVRNEGRGLADAVNVKCTVGGILVGVVMVESIPSGGLGVAVCDAQVSGPDDALAIEVVADSTASIDETSENNNDRLITMIVSERETDSGSIIDSFDRGPAVVFLSIGIILIALTALYFSPSKVRKPYEHRK